MVQVYPDADLGEVVRKMRDLGVKGIVGSRQNPLFSRVRLLLSPSEIAALREPLAGLRDVFWIDLEGRRSCCNDTTIWVGQSGLSGGQTTPIFSQGIFGEGQTVGIIDTGIDPTLCYFRDTARGLPPTNACNGGTVVDTAQRKIDRRRLPLGHRLRRRHRAAPSGTPRTTAPTWPARWRATTSPTS